MPGASSLIFVVILAVWAVYLVQHWVRRREHLATARSVDRYSEAMRVLERRRALSRSETVGAAANRAAAPSPLRPSRPQVVVKHAQARSRVVATAAFGTPARRARTAARLRAAALLAGSVAMFTLVVLGVAEVLAWWWTFVGVAVLASAVSAVRWSVSATRGVSRRTTARPVPRTGTEPARAVGTEHALAAQSLAATMRVSAPAHPATRPTARRAVQVAATRPAPAVKGQLFDHETHGRRADAAPAPERAGEPEVAQPVAQQHDAPQWQPVPVPPPTYTLKARAYRPANGSTELPADGTEMALDEEFEELPSVNRVG